MRRINAMAAVLLGLLASTLGVAAPAIADTGNALDPQIAAVMDEVPGGIIIDDRHAVWPDIGMEMLVPSPIAAFSVGACATGKVCAFSGYNTSGAQLNWSTCSTFSISAFTVRSIADARSTGYLQARNGTTVVATAKAGALANVYGTTTNVRCVS